MLQNQFPPGKPKIQEPIFVLPAVLIIGVKIMLILLLFGCLLNWPYYYFQLVRFICFAGFIFLAIPAIQQFKYFVAFFYISLALLFQPFLKVALGRTLWNIVDVIVALFLISTLLIDSRKNSNK